MIQYHPPREFHCVVLQDLRKHGMFAPYGFNGGSEGAKGRAVLIENGIERELPGKCNVQVHAGAVLRIETPGGGGWGAS